MQDTLRARYRLIGWHHRAGGKDFSLGLPWLDAMMLCLDAKLRQDALHLGQVEE